ncbi:pseudouridine-5'-phosphatase [Rhipicephalus sanguineus]|nr:pseudouridine-5'-phosphatase [Rhipicephalus sanguineus]
MAKHRYFLNRFYHVVSSGTDQGVRQSVLHSEILYYSVSKLDKKTPSQETPRNSTRAAAEMLASSYGKQFTWELDRRVLGTPDFDAARTIVESLGLPITPSECMEKLNKICGEYYHDCDLMPGAERLLRHLKAHGVPMAVATSTTPALFDLKMSRHRDLVPLFHHVVCTGGGTKVKRGKPHPDIFLLAASMFDEKPPSEKV